MHTFTGFFPGRIEPELVVKGGHPVYFGAVDGQVVGHQRKGLVRQIAQGFLGHLEQRNKLPPALGSVTDKGLEGFPGALGLQR